MGLIDWPEVWAVVLALAVYTYVVEPIINGCLAEVKKRRKRKRGKKEEAKASLQTETTEPC
jgi:hypothetical protein